ncbi:MAG: SAM-dependent methyltransferase [Hyphomicrobiales bacterium]|nr:MAG: SAM-dependent methyltransferase [Hyphomicrobiales bacterium]
MTYPGGKNAAGVAQRIINHMPPHKTYLEMFLGSGAILRNKRPAETNIGIDKSQKALDLCSDLAVRPFSHCMIIGCGIEYLRNHFCAFGPTALIYCDPPYMPETRKGGDLYDYEMTEADHKMLLRVLKSTDAMVMISGYRCPLYDRVLKDWHRIDYKAQTRRGMVDENLWMNFQPPNELHDYSFLGANYRERDNIKKKQKRLKARLQKMPRLELLAIMEVMNSI